VVTTSRADYGHLVWPLRELRARPDVDLRLVVLGAHLSPEFGHTVTAIERDGFAVDERLECLLSSDSDVGMAKTIGVATLSLADAFARRRPDLLLLIADRYEMLAPAATALALRIPIAHIEGGEVSEGAVDHAVRNALTMMAHVHLTPTRAARERVIAMGEEPWRVHRVGAPSLDHLVRSTLLDAAATDRALGLDLGRPTVVVAYHPVTLDRNTIAEADAVFDALGRLDEQIVFCFPNADAGSRALIDRARSFCDARADAHLFVNLDHLVYWSVLRRAAVMLGNSSSAIMESPSLALPAVNIGRRQQGRERARNVIDVEADADAIVNAVSVARSATFRASLAGMTNPYGEGDAGRRIAALLATLTIDDRLLMKRASPVVDGRHVHPDA
ncbi:MAG: UDP-N-acetylglucosamine 2-epimerase (hydrolyzing), partial [Phycisphaerales bacterium]|nr:UDP-N-acetylglucosamine 2-epimerase (hydrolyzing) [Phycisphaerales bacterium]